MLHKKAKYRLRIALVQAKALVHSDGINPGSTERWVAKEVRWDSEEERYKKRNLSTRCGYMSHFMFISTSRDYITRKPIHPITRKHTQTPTCQGTSRQLWMFV